MTADEPAYLIVGHVRKPHGTKGELVVESLTDHPGDVFVSGVVLRPGDASADAPDGSMAKQAAAKSKRGGKTKASGTEGATGNE